MLKVENIPSSPCFVGNLQTFRVTSDGPFLFSLALDGGNVILRERYIPTPGNMATDIDVREVLKDIFDIQYPQSGLMVQNGFSRKILYLIGDSGEVSGSFTVLAGGCQNVGQEYYMRHWLTLQPQCKEVCQTQAEWLTTYYCGENGGSIIARFHSDSGHEDIIIASGLESGKCYCVETGPQRIWQFADSRQYGMYDIFVQGPDGARLSYIQRYVIKEDTDDSRVFLFQNSLGGWDTARLSGSYEYTPETAYTALTGGNEEVTGSTIDTRHTYIQRTGLLSALEYRWIVDMLCSSKVYRWIDGSFVPVVITESSLTVSSAEPVKSAEFSYMFGDGRSLPLPERNMASLAAFPIGNPGDIQLIRLLSSDGTPVSHVSIPATGSAEQINVYSKEKWVLK